MRRFKKFKRFILAALSATMLNSSLCYAKMGDMSFFGGISQGTRLPKTTEILLAATTTANTTANNPSLVYKEVIFISGKPVVFEGILTIRSGTIPENTVIGTYNETHTIAPSASTDPNATLRRTITFKVNYRVEGRQIIKDYQATRWTEVIVIDDAAFLIDPDKSSISLSIIQDNAPGVTYYKGDISQTAVYIPDDEQDAPPITHETNGSFYGYNSAWSATETHRVNGTVYTDDWQMQYQIRPSVSVSKTLQYSKNEPTAISFQGNYQELLQNQSGLQYDIFVKPKQFYELDDTGLVNIDNINSFEQLLAPNVKFLQGHAAQSDIEKLFSMKILEGDPKLYKPEQAITRGQFTAAVAKAIKLPITTAKPTTNTRTAIPINIVFPDVTTNRPEYPYIMAMYKANLTFGRSNGYFYADSPLERQEAIAILLRTLGLENLALDPTPMTAFTDDDQVSGWAKQEIAAALAIGLISPDEDGNFKPLDMVSKAEAAALINRLISYMRSDLATDYADHIVNYSD